MKLNLIPTDLLKEYCSNFNQNLKENFSSLKENELSLDSFSFYTSVSAVFSSKIEGEDIDLDSFIKHKRFGTKYLADYTRKIDDLYDAYIFAKENKLNEENLIEAQAKITTNILAKSQQGKVRTNNMYVLTDEGKIEYIAISPEKLKAELILFYEDLKTLLNKNLTFEEIFFFASILHLVFVKIHPFNDGNGRTARLLEKWFLAEKLGENSWFIQSEKNYYENHQLYYTNIRKLGLEYDELNYSKSLDFILMLSNSF